MLSLLKDYGPPKNGLRLLFYGFLFISRVQKVSSPELLGAISKVLRGGRSIRNETES